MSEQEEFIIISSRIKKLPGFGNTEKTDTLIARSDPNTMSEEFKEALWDNYSITIEDLQMKPSDENKKFVDTICNRTQCAIRPYCIEHGQTCAAICIINNQTVIP